VGLTFWLGFLLLLLWGALFGITHGTLSTHGLRQYHSLLRAATPCQADLCLINHIDVCARLIPGDR
jgi:hypothetical protein